MFDEGVRGRLFGCTFGLIWKCKSLCAVRCDGTLGLLCWFFGSILGAHDAQNLITPHVGSWGWIFAEAVRPSFVNQTPLLRSEIFDVENDHLKSRIQAPSTKQRAGCTSTVFVTPRPRRIPNVPNQSLSSMEGMMVVTATTDRSPLPAANHPKLCDFEVPMACTSSLPWNSWTLNGMDV